jgi:DNA-binding FadR family transcriptional regulator
VVAEVGTTLNRALELLLTLEQVNLRELFEVRRILEGEAAALAASRRDEDDLGRIGAEIEAMEAGLDSEDGFITADLRFHLTIAEASGNRLIAHLMEAIRTLLQRSLSSAYHIPGSPEGAVVLHGLILDAISAGHPEEARQRMQEHVSRVERDITGAGR